MKRRNFIKNLGIGAATIPLGAKLFELRDPVPREPLITPAVRKELLKTRTGFIKVKIGDNIRYLPIYDSV